jgi:hypothetical protein
MFLIYKDELWKYENEDDVDIKGLFYTLEDLK